VEISYVQLNGKLYASKTRVSIVGMNCFCGL